MKRTAAQKREGYASETGRFLRMADIVATVGLSESTVRRLINAGDFPRPKALTARCVGWWQADVDAWMRRQSTDPPG